MRKCTFASLALTLVAVFAGPGEARAQVEAFRFGFGYVANAPEMLAGLQGMVILPALGGIGLYADLKFDAESPDRDEYFVADRTALQVEDQIAGVRFIDHRDSYQGLNVALVRPVNPALMLYAGVGVATMTRYREYLDPSEQLGQAGYFWVEATDEEATFTNVLAGIFMRVSPVLSLQTGFETNPKGFTVGATFLLPKR